MKKYNKNINPKKFKSQTLTGQKGVNLIEGIVLDMGFVWNPSNLDAGIDGIIEIRNTVTEEATNFIIQVQSKATINPFTADNGNTFEYLCDEKDLDYWLKGNCPVILVCSNVIEKDAYWISVKDYFKDSTKRKNRKVLFDKKKNAFTLDSKDDLLNLAIPETVGYYLSPTPIKEIVYSNLLPLVQCKSSAKSLPLGSKFSLVFPQKQLNLQKGKHHAKETNQERKINQGSSSQHTTDLQCRTKDSYSNGGYTWRDEYRRTVPQIRHQ